MKKPNDEKSKILWNESYKLKHSSNLWGDNFVPFIDDIIDIYKENEMKTILDLPCGDGRNLIPLANSLPFVVGADSSLESLNISDKRLKSINAIFNYVLLETDVFNTQFINNQFDGILCWDLLGHLNNAESAIEELLRILKHGGIFICSVFSINDSTRGKEMENIPGTEEYVYDSKFYFKFYTENEVRMLIDKFDVDLLDLKEVSWNEPPHEGYREYPHEHTSWAAIIRK